MKVIIDVPDSELPTSIQDMIKRPGLNGEERRAIVYACLMLAIDEFHVARVSVAEYRLELK